MYQKSTRTDRYLDFTSHHPLTHKAAVVRTLFSRADSISSCALKLHEEHTNITRALRVNQYSNKFVSRICPQTRVHPNDVSPTKKRMDAPYIHGLSEGIQRILLRVDIRVTFWPRQEFVRPKDPIPLLSKANVFYCIPCTTCQEVYIGQTSRSLETHLKQICKD